MTQQDKSWEAAFPRVGQGFSASGMSLRDYFAAKAPPMTVQWREDSARAEQCWTEAQAAWSYVYADAMLRARGDVAQ